MKYSLKLFWEKLFSCVFIHQSSPYPYPQIHAVKDFEPNKEDVFSVKTFDQLNLEPR